MKNLFLLLVPCLIVLTPVAMKAQTVVNHEQMDEGPVENYLAPDEPVRNGMAAYRNIHIKAVREFKTTYKTVDNESWSITPAGYQARFVDDGALYLVFYNKKGKWLHTKKQFDETKLDKEVRAQIKSVYYDYTIFLIEEIEEPQKSVSYIVHMEDANSYKHIRIRDKRIDMVMDVDKL
jgi:hypothetical protein